MTREEKRILDINMRVFVYLPLHVQTLNCKTTSKCLQKTGVEVHGGTEGIS